MSGDPTIPAPPLSPEAFLSSGWREALAASEKRQCWEYFVRLCERAEALEKEGRSGEAATLKAIARACHMTLKPSDPEGPLVPLYEGERGRTTALDDFGPSELDLFAAVLDEIDDTELQARLGDVLWLRCRDGRAGLKAAAAYLASSKALLQADQLVASDATIRRALDIAAHLGRQNQAYTAASTELIALARQLAAAGERKKCIGILRALIHHGEGDPAEVAPMMQEWALGATDEKDWIWAQHWWELARKYSALGKDGDGVERARRGSAATFVRQAEDEEAKGPGRQGVAAHWLHAAVHALRQVKSCRSERERLTARALALQEQSLDEMGQFRHTFDLTELLEAAESAVTKPTLREALVALACLVTPSAVSDLEDQVREQARVAPFSHMLGAIGVDKGGRVRSRKRAMPLGTEVGAAVAFRARVVEQANHHQTIHAIVVDRIRSHILDQHFLPGEEMAQLAWASPFIPPGRELATSRGLDLGLRGDYATSAHLLVPQLEHALRWHLNRVGVLTLTHDQDGVQRERNLKQLLAMEGLEGFLDRDTIFDLQALLVEEVGPNLRNEVAHGLLDDGQLRAWPPKYFWWAVLRLCVLPLVSSDPRERDRSSAHDAEGP